MAGPSTHYDIDEDEVVDLHDESYLDDFVNGIKYKAVMELEFASKAEGREFYNSYARIMGFSMRKDNVVCLRGYMGVVRICGMHNGCLMKCLNEILLSWNSIIAAFSANGYYSKALDSFWEMKLNTGLKPNLVSIVSVLPVCAGLEDEVTAREIHGYAVKAGLHSQVTIGNALVDVYGKCGNSKAFRRKFLIECLREMWCLGMRLLLDLSSFGVLPSDEPFKDLKGYIEKVSWSKSIVHVRDTPHAEPATDHEDEDMEEDEPVAEGAPSMELLMKQMAQMLASQASF
ncbi:hypothetical protein HHK36_019475 [Tetracentron sinense]|uniref:Pentatricopeptide repeat-containing protein n=1 Tax=Tetracentron sinense TaxID=13715 RepID=A0A834Z298_TETSI|nr:hypothetical protein HHK36_019475 [Tetracentron sinense]